MTDYINKILESIVIDETDEVFVPQKVVIEITKTRCLLLDACVGGWVQAEPKKLYFVDKRCRKTAQASIFIGEMICLGTFGFWYENEQTLLHDFRYQMNWHSAIANYPLSFGGSISGYEEKIIEFFDSSLSVKISKNKAEHYIDFLYENGFFKLLERPYEEMEQDIIEDLCNYDDDLLNHYELIFK